MPRKPVLSKSCESQEKALEAWIPKEGETVVYDDNFATVKWLNEAQTHAQIQLTAGTREIKVPVVSLKPFKRPERKSNHWGFNLMGQKSVLPYR